MDSSCPTWSTLPVGATSNRPEGDVSDPIVARHRYPNISIPPTDEAMMNSFVHCLMMKGWNLPTIPIEMEKRQEYVMPPALTGHSIWIQRKQEFLQDKNNSSINGNRIYVVEKETFVPWIQATFNARTVGQCGPTQNRCFIFKTYNHDFVLWVDKQDIGLHPPLDLPVGSGSGSGGARGSYDIPPGNPEDAQAGGHQCRHRPPPMSSENPFGVREKVSRWLSTENYANPARRRA
ncbi:hypothetical protein GGR50DRAFT_672689 [Xylaria sp. CBS 124048]|nr:hypothetical protein GGR50DRAFT_672689 [Xylaria sp. CBS 124048]